MDDKIKILNKRVKELDEDLEVVLRSSIEGYDDILFLESKEGDINISLGAYFLKSGSTLVDYIYSNYDEAMIKKYYENIHYLTEFFTYCKELFEGYDDINEKIEILNEYMKNYELPGHFRLSVEYDECANKVILLWSDFMLTQFIQGKVCGYNIDKKYLYSLLDQDKPIPNYYEYVQYKFSKKCDELFNKGEE